MYISGGKLLAFFINIIWTPMLSKNYDNSIKTSPSQMKALTDPCVANLWFGTQYCNVS